MSTKISFTKRSAVGLLCALVVIAISTQASESPSAYAPVNGLKMYYEIHGETASQGPPLVLLHGGGSTIQTTFGKVLPHLAKTRQVIAFEQQGHGRTADIAERPFSFEQSADDAVALLGNSLTETNHDWRPRQERKIEAYE